MMKTAMLKGFQDEMSKLAIDPILAGMIAGGGLGALTGVGAAKALAKLIERNKDYAAGLAAMFGAAGGGFTGLMLKSKLFNEQARSPSFPRAGDPNVRGIMG